MRTIAIRALVTSLSFVTILVSHPPCVADYPERPVKYIIPFGAGGESGTTARLQQPIFKKLTGQDLVIKYRPGGGGALASIMVVILMVTNQFFGDSNEFEQTRTLIQGGSNSGSSSSN